MNNQVLIDRELLEKACRVQTINDTNEVIIGRNTAQATIRQLLATPAPIPDAAEGVEPCQHEWTDDGQFLLVCTACGAQEDHDPHWRPIETAPRDGSMLRLLVEFSEHSTEDEDQAPTIGANNFENDGEDRWQFAGWCWSHDHFVQGEGVPVGWLPMLDVPVSALRDGGAVPPLIQCLHENGDLIAANATIAQQAKMIEALQGDVPYGWRLVPIEPTLAMVEALKGRMAVTNRGGILNAGHALTAAVMAAPLPSSPAGGVEP